MIAFYGLILGSGAFVFFVLRKSHRREDELLNYSLTGGGSSRPQAKEVSNEVGSYLRERALIISSMIVRAASEIHLQQAERQDTQVTTRQTLNTLLRQTGLWDKLEPDEAALVVAADGRWTLEQSNQVSEMCEQLRLLRWTLRDDSELMPLAHFPIADYSLARGLLENPELTISREPLRGTWDVRVERDIAAAYLARIFVELKDRRLINNDPEASGWATQLRSQFLGPSRDLLAGAKTIAELDNTNLRLLGVTAAARQRYAAYLVELLAADRPIAFASWLRQTESDA